MDVRRLNNEALDRLRALGPQNECVYKSAGGVLHHEGSSGEQHPKREDAIVTLLRNVDVVNGMGTGAPLKLGPLKHYVLGTAASSAEVEEIG
ncbi:hypothetical protein ANCCEY_14023 [Ancylostoma ceylanicum]|uniref:Uncharacterized protein n=1 Tax=Ancylostoma ceylanicum TaxID=53326 RepID=A0A0D6LAU3_9BILA|nr:hypothetical protein ANCCEY_14023 [Ancylostoma ceylanicum]